MLLERKGGLDHENDTVVLGYPLVFAILGFSEQASAQTSDVLRVFDNKGGAAMGTISESQEPFTLSVTFTPTPIRLTDTLGVTSDTLTVSPITVTLFSAGGTESSPDPSEAQAPRVVDLLLESDDGGPEFDALTVNGNRIPFSESVGPITIDARTITFDEDILTIGSFTITATSDTAIIDTDLFTSPESDRLTVDVNATSFGMPEPGTLALLATGLLGLGIMCRRKTTKSTCSADR